MALLLIMVLDFFSAIFPCESLPNIVAVESMAGLILLGETREGEAFFYGGYGITAGNFDMFSRLWNMVASEGPIG